MKFPGQLKDTTQSQLIITETVWISEDLATIVQDFQCRHCSCYMYDMEFFFAMYIILAIFFAAL